jgi:hypothetical protein
LDSSKSGYSLLNLDHGELSPLLECFIEILVATGFTQAKDIYGVGDLREAMFLGYFGCPGLSLLGFNLNSYATTIADQVMVVIFRAVSEEAFAGVD